MKKVLFSCFRSNRSGVSPGELCMIIAFVWVFTAVGVRIVAASFK